MAECPTKFSLVKWLAADLPPNEMKTVELHLSRCRSCHDIVASITQDKDEYEANRVDHLSRLRESLATGLDREEPDYDTHSKKLRRLLPAFSALAAAAIIIIALAVLFHPTGRNAVQDDISFRGPVAFRVVVQRAEAQFFIENGARLRENDALRFIVTTGSSGYLFICSIDSEGHVFPFYPETDPLIDAAPLRLETPGRHELPGSVILDNQLGTEYLVVVFSKETFSRKKIHRLLTQQHLKLKTGLERGKDYPASLVVDKLMIRKTP